MKTDDNGKVRKELLQDVEAFIGHLAGLNIIDVIAVSAVAIGMLSLMLCLL